MHHLEYGGNSYESFVLSLLLHCFFHWLIVKFSNNDTPLIIHEINFLNRKRVGIYIMSFHNT